MKSAIVIVMTLAVASLFGCQTSRRGGSMVENEGFRIAVPTFTTDGQTGRNPNRHRLTEKGLAFQTWT